MAETKREILFEKDQLLLKLYCYYQHFLCPILLSMCYKLWESFLLLKVLLLLLVIHLILLFA